MKRDKDKKPINPPSGWLSFCIALMIVSIVAKLIDRVCWFAFLRQAGHTSNELVVSRKVWVEYAKHFPGNILTMLTFGVWMLLLIVIFVLQIKERLGRTRKPRLPRVPLGT